MKPLIEKALSSLEKPLAMRIFFLISFLESALLPIPIESLSIPLFTARKNPWPIVIWGTVSSVAGGMVGYLIGFGLYETLGKWMIETYGFAEQFTEWKEQAASNLGKGAWIILMGAVLPIPFKLVSIAAGAVQFAFPLFLVVAVVGRGIRYAAFGLAFALFGDRLRAFVQDHPRVMTAIIIGVMIAGFAVLFF